MITDLAPFMVFLHGLSGSGKGEMQRELTTQSEARGYRVYYASSGDLFRAAREDPTIAEQMQGGLFIETLGPILPGLKAIYQAFLVAWLESVGRAILILDGVIRRDTFVNADGAHVPSQIYQLATGLDEVNAMVWQGQQSARASVLFGSAADVGTDRGVALCEELIRSAVHVLLDVRPEDAENQMRQRARKELDNIRRRLNSGTGQRRRQPDAFEAVVDKLDDLVQGMTVQRAEDEDVPVAYTDAHGAVGEGLSKLLDDQVKAFQRELAKALSLPPSASFAELFQAKGIPTNLRADDISPVGRTTRIRNFIMVHEGPDGPIYARGFAAQALTNDLCFSFRPDDGSFDATADNCIVIPNGASKGIDLAGLRRACEKHTQDILGRAESRRTSLLGS